MSAKGQRGEHPRGRGIETTVYLKLSTRQDLTLDTQNGESLGQVIDRWAASRRLSKSTRKLAPPDYHE